MTKTYRPASATVAVVGAGLLGLFLLGDVFVRGGLVQGLLVAPWVLFALWSIYTLLYASVVRIDEHAIVVVNPLRVTRVPWSAVADIQLRWQLAVVTVEGRVISAFGGPSPGRPARLGRAARASESDEARTPSGLRQVDEIREAWHEHSGDAVDTAVTTAANRAVLVPLAVVVASALIALVVGL
ncbi:PH domain-containing protein [Microbacterium sp. cf332]|uniref:PH domain-containing protein n=1 Tax=Microbacterium sp. cf332 TaxID=1761804 RepID=UPI000882E79E|nr:PH domain-containing protein [Microbacterium sp. cf332]SDQ06567.1 PH domain-containing protein [Microbacterium sp. cf332]